MSYAVDELLLSQEDQLQSHRSTHRMSCSSLSWFEVSETESEDSMLKNWHYFSQNWSTAFEVWWDL